MPSPKFRQKLALDRKKCFFLQVFTLLCTNENRPKVACNGDVQIFVDRIFLSWIPSAHTAVYYVVMAVCHGQHPCSPQVPHTATIEVTSRMMHRHTSRSSARSLGHGVNCCSHAARRGDGGQVPPSFVTRLDISQEQHDDHSRSRAARFDVYLRRVSVSVHGVRELTSTVAVCGKLRAAKMLTMWYSDKKSHDKIDIWVNRDFNETIVSTKIFISCIINRWSHDQYLWGNICSCTKSGDFGLFAEGYIPQPVWQ